MTPIPRGPARTSADVTPTPRGLTPTAPGVTPSPRLLYVHDDLTDLARGAGETAASLAAALLARLADDRERVVVLTLDRQVEALVAAGPHAPFEATLGLGRAGVRVARAVHERTGWFPRVREVGVSREEHAGGYRLVSTTEASLGAQCAGLDDAASVAVVDDTIYSGLTMRAVLEELGPAVRRRAHAFCLRAVARSLPAIAALCPVTAGIAAPGRIDRDVCFINASGLVVAGAIRRAGLPPLTFCDRREWIAAWFPGYADDVLALALALRQHLEEATA